MIRLGLSLSLIALLAVGCKSKSFRPYVSPRVTGQVFAANTRQPLSGVKVARGSSRPRAPRGASLRGAELLLLKAPAQTDRAGRFALASERVLSIVRGANWNVVSLSFERMGYTRFQTNCPAGLATNSAAGEPVLEIGPIFLQPATR